MSVTLKTKGITEIVFVINVSTYLSTLRLTGASVTEVKALHTHSFNLRSTSAKKASRENGSRGMRNRGVDTIDAAVFL